MSIAVVSLLDMMGVGIYARDGTPVRKGAEREGGDPWLTEDEVRGLIAMGVEDLQAGGEGGGPYTLADLHAALAPLLPQLSLAEFAAAYSTAYSEHPDDLVPQVMLGQPIEPATPLTRVQLWLLFMDGFVGPAGSGTAGVSDGIRLAVAAPGPGWGTARMQFPPIPTPDPNLTEEEWRELETHLLTLADRVRFSVRHPGGAHEGHGRLGSTVTVMADVSRAHPLMSPTTGRTILQARTGSLAGIDVTWRSRDESALRRHGSLDVRLPATMSTDDLGDAQVHFTPRKEDADGVGSTAREVASLYLTAGRRQLVERTYVIADPRLERLIRDIQLGDTITADGQSFAVEWHVKEGIEVELINGYDVAIDTSPAGLQGRAHRNGTDAASGTLTRRPDGTWRGTLRAGGEGTTEMAFGGQTCRGSENFTQDLDVVGTERPTGPIDPGQVQRQAGSFGGGDLLLRFYPAAAPGGDLGTCHGAIGYYGPGPDGREIDAWYAPFNDARWTTPSIGYQIHLPASGVLRYDDYGSYDRSLETESIWHITVDRTAP